VVFAGFAEEIEVLAEVSAKVTDGGIDLGESNSHGSIVQQEEVMGHGGSEYEKKGTSAVVKWIISLEIGEVGFIMKL